MRTTIRMDDDLRDRLRQYCLDRDITVTAAIKEALSHLLADERPPQSFGIGELPTYRGGGGPRRQVELDSIGRRR